MRQCERQGCTAELGPRQTRFHSRACAAAGARTCTTPRRLSSPLPDRSCPACGAALVRRDGEKLSDFRRRQSCGEACRARLRAEGRTAPTALPAPVVEVAPPSRPAWRPAGWPAEIPAAVLRNRGVAA